MHLQYSLPRRDGLPNSAQPEQALSFCPSCPPFHVGHGAPHRVRECGLIAVQHFTACRIIVNRSYSPHVPLDAVTYGAYPGFSAHSQVPFL